MVRSSEGNSKVKLSKTKMVVFADFATIKPMLCLRWFKHCCTAAPKLWNCLPADIRCITTISSFKKHLKTYLFNEGYKQLQ